MNLAQAFQSVINRPPAESLAAALAISGLLLVIGCALLLGGRRRWVGLGIGALGLLGTMAVLLIVDQQTTTFRESDSVIVTRPRYRERTRTVARCLSASRPWRHSQPWEPGPPRGAGCAGAYRRS